MPRLQVGPGDKLVVVEEVSGAANLGFASDAAAEGSVTKDNPRRASRQKVRTPLWSHITNYSQRSSRTTDLFHSDSLLTPPHVNTSSEAPLFANLSITNYPSLLF